jgi:uncharacterized protein (DUF433 family)
MISAFADRIMNSDNLDSTHYVERTPLPGLLGFPRITGRRISVVIIVN